MKVQEENQEFLTRQVLNAGGRVSVEYDEEGVCVSDTVSVWNEAEETWLEITDVYVLDGLLQYSGFTDHGNKMNSLYPSDMDSYEHIEEFLSMYIDGYQEFQPSTTALRAEILASYKEYRNKLESQITELLQAHKVDRLHMASGKSLTTTKDGIAYVEQPDGKRTSDTDQIIAFLKLFKA